MSATARQLHNPLIGERLHFDEAPQRLATEIGAVSELSVRVATATPYLQARAAEEHAVSERKRMQSAMRTHLAACSQSERVPPTTSDLHATTLIA